MARADVGDPARYRKCLVWFPELQEAMAMSRDYGDAVKRPDRVVIVDADDPLTEIYGQFVWLEEHDRVLADARSAAYLDGYEAGRRDAEPVRFQLLRRRGLGSYLVMAIVAVAALIATLMLPIILF